MTYDSLLTIIIPVFNTADFLPRCLDSLINQTYKKCKILLVDDCSTDNSLDIIRLYAQKYVNIEYLTNSMQLGAGSARNKGLEQVSTKYICFLDSDDWVDSNTYENVIKFLDKNDECNIATFGVKTEYESPFLSKYKCKYEYSNIIESRYALNIFCKTMNYDLSISSMLGNKVFRTELLKDNNIKFSHKYFEDVYFTFLSFFYSNYVGVIEDAYLHYYQRQNSIMHSFSPQYIDGLIDVLYDLKKFLIEKECLANYKKEYYALFNKSIYSLMNMIFSTEQNDIIQKRCICYFAELLTKKFDITEFISNLDINVIKEIFTPRL